MFHDKKEYMTRERRDISKAVFWFSGILNLKPSDVIDATRSQQCNGIDYILHTSQGQITLENKTRYKNFNRCEDILFETISDDTKNSVGWMGSPDRVGYSKADILAYGWQLPNRSYFGYCFDLTELKLWWRRQDINDFEYPSPTRNNGYYTHNRIVPIYRIPKDIILYSDIPDDI